MRKLLIWAGLFIASIYYTHNYVASGGLLRFADEHPHQRGVATMLFYMGSFYELMNKHERTIDYFSRIVERYPKSQYGLDAQMGVAYSYEAMKKFARAIAEYQKLLEMYPGSKYETTVKNNIYLLR